MVFSIFIFRDFNCYSVNTVKYVLPVSLYIVCLKMLIDRFVLIFRELQYEIKEDVRSDLKKRRGLNRNQILANKYEADINYIGRKKTGAKQARRLENCK